MTVLLLGDSNLARLYHDLPDLARLAFGSDVECRAVGGAWSGSLRDQIDSRNPPDYDAIVLSIGSSDNHLSFASSPAIFKQNLSRELDRGGRWIALVPPRLKRALDPSRTDEVNKLIQVYARILTELIKASGGISIDVHAIISRLGSSAFDPDGMHLTRTAYEQLAPKIANAITTISQ